MTDAATPKWQVRAGRLAAALTAAVTIVGAASLCDAADTPPTGVIPSTTTPEKTIQLERDGCTAQLERQPDDDTFIYHNDCRQDLATRADVFARLVAAVLPTAADRENGATVLVPSLEKTFPDFARRLAQAAARSPEWYGERAKRNPKFGNPLVVKIANSPPIYRELQEALRPLDLRVRLTAVNDVQIAVPPETPFAFWLSDRGVNAREQVPYDAAVSFRVIE